MSWVFNDDLFDFILLSVINVLFLLLNKLVVLLFSDKIRWEVLKNEI